MCGIAGYINYDQGVDGAGSCWQTMLDTMTRRGPDQQGTYQSGAALLLHARLSVVDLEHGKQPFCYQMPDGQTYALVYNGELYNTDALRITLLDMGHQFESHSDTEVLLHAYIQWGADCVYHLNGIFAFAIWESSRQRLFVARDRIGVKPFFFAKQGSAWLFASELKTLLAHPDVHPVIDGQSVQELLLIGPGRTPGYGIFQGIAELEPATCGYYSRDGLHTWRYWSLEAHPHQDDFEATVEQVRHLVTDAIERQLVADVPVGAFLSGGLDSSIISAIADRYFTRQGKTLHTFSVGYVDNARYFKSSKFQPNSDESYIETMTSALHGEHHNIILNHNDVADALFAAAEARDLPGMADVDASLLLFCKAVKPYVTVALSGECADEIFGGYPWYRDKTIRETDGFPWAQSTLYRAAFLQPQWLQGVDPHQYVEEKYRQTVAETARLPRDTPLERRMREMVNLNFKWFMQTLLDRKDRMSMWSGLEVRVPFCDYRIAQYLYNVPWSMKDYKGREKGLLREAVRGLLPQPILERKKSPYPKTHHPAYLEAVSAMLQEVLADEGAPLWQLIQPDRVRLLLQGAGDQENPWYGQLMTRPQTIAYFVQLNHWLTHYHVTIR